MRRTGGAGELYAPDEEYLNVAVTRLLPEFYSAHAEVGTGAVLRGLADRLIARHGDRWLADALKTPHSPNAGAAFAALGRAHEAAEAWDLPIAGKEARRAIPLFQSADGAAGVVFARLEELFAFGVEGRAPECTQAAASLLQSVQAHLYAWLETQATLEKGNCATRMGDPEVADEEESRALEQALDEHYPVLYLRALGLNASRHAKIGNVFAAWRENFNGLTLYWAGRYPPLRAHQFYSALELLAQESGAIHPAVAWSRELASIDSIPRYKNISGPTLWQLGMAELGAGFEDSAYRDLQRSIDSDPKMRTATRPQIDLAAVETTQGKLDKALSHLQGVQTVAEKDDGLLRLQFAAELGRLQLRRGKYQESRKLLDQARLIGERSWSRAPKEGRVLWSRAMASIYRGLVECEIKAVEDRRQARARTLWSQYRARLFARGDTIAAAKETLLPGEGRISFAELPSGLAVWLETERGLSFHSIESTELLYASVGRLSRDCASERSRPAVVRAEAKDLSLKLLGSWDGQLDGVRKLIVETDGTVAQIPWLALVRQNDHYWSDDFALRIRSGASGVTAVAPVASDSQALVVGAPAFSGLESLAPLPNALSEAEKVSGLFSRSIPLMGISAVLREVRGQLVQAQLFHFSGHGYGGEGGGLLLRGATGGPALLRAADIQDLDLSRCSLVVLAGCSTAAGERGGPGDPQSLVRAFLQAGAADVVAGLWDLDSDGTQEIVDKFYESLLSGSPVAESLGKAAAAVRSDSRYKHPYYWAGLEVFSNN
ncbi:MAG: CHAT domain-containing protein [Bryobacteraceae bacterium]